MNERTFTPHYLQNPDKLEIHARGLDHVRKVYGEGHQSDHAGAGRSAPAWSQLCRY